MTGGASINDDMLGWIVFAMVVAFVVYGNFRIIEKLFQEHPDKAITRCFKTIL